MKSIGTYLVIVIFLLSVWNPDASAQVHEIHLATVNSNYRFALDKIASEYEALHPNVKVRISIVTNEYSAWLRTQFAGGERIAPDIYNGNYTSEYVALGRWTPLNDYLKQINPYTGVPWMDSLNAPFVERFYFGGVAYYIPIDFIDVAFVYNVDIFEQLGLEAPQTWSQMLEVCRTIQDRGHTVTVRGRTGEPIIPMTMPGNARALWEGSVGWFQRILDDAYHRSELDMIRAQPGDWNYNPERDAVFPTDFSDRYADNLITINAERRLLAIRDGRLRVDSEKSRAVYGKILELSQFWPRGFLGIDHGQAETLFLQQKAAISFTTSHFVTNANRIWRRLAPEDQFRWSAFAPPHVDDDPLCEGPLRGIGNAGMNLVVTRKSDPEHEKRVVDFMMFLTTPRSGQIFFDETLANDMFIVGPIQIQGVQMPEELSRKYEPFLNRGFEKIGLRSGTIEFEWTILLQELLGRRIDLDTFLEQNQKIWEESVDREIKRFNYDLDPTTRDDIALQMEAPPRNLLNPFENGILMVALLMVGLVLFMVYQYRRASGLYRSEALVAYALLLPTMTGLVFFMAFPALSGLYRAFTESSADGSIVFIGLENLIRMASDFFIYRASVNMAILTVTNILKSTIIPFLVAELLIGLPFERLRRIFRTLFLIPVVVPSITLILIWGFVYDPNIGLLNAILRAMGFSGYSWLGEPWLALPSIIGVGFPWVGTLGLLIYMAALLQINPSVHEAARLDCLTTTQRVWHIDFPMVRSQTKLLVILTLIGSLQGFQLNLLMTNGGPGLATSVPALQMYQYAFKFGQFGYAASIGFVLFVLILIFTLLNLKFIRSESDL